MIILSKIYNTKICDSQKNLLRLPEVPGTHLSSSGYFSGYKGCEGLHYRNLLYNCGAAISSEQTLFWKQLLLWQFIFSLL